MQLKKTIYLSTITAAILTTSYLHAENYVSVEYLQYDESDDRVTVTAPMLEVSYDFNADYNLKASIMYDGVSGATPSYMTNEDGDLFKGLQDFDDDRTAASLLLTTRFENRDELYTGIDFSREEDYQSLTGSVEYMHYLDATHNTAVNVGLSIAYNEILVYDGDTGASAYDGDSGASHTEDSMNYYLQGGITQVLTKDSSVKVAAFVGSDDGYLTNPHGRIVRDYSTQNATLDVENRPDNRLMYGFTLKYNKMLTENISYIGAYRLYADDWDIMSHTIDNDIYIKLTEQFTLGVGLRYYTQSQAEFYHEDIGYFTDEKYASSDERLSDFDALTYKVNIDFKQNDTFSYNIGAEYYDTSTVTDLSATIFTVGMKYKF